MHLEGLKIIYFNEIKIPFFLDSPTKTAAQYAAPGKTKENPLTRHRKRVEQHEE